jgi:hypothetical protein
MQTKNSTLLHLGTTAEEIRRMTNQPARIIMPPKPAKVSKKDNYRKLPRTRIYNLFYRRFVSAQKRLPTEPERKEIWLAVESELKEGKNI